MGEEEYKYHQIGRKCLNEALTFPKELKMIVCSFISTTNNLSSELRGSSASFCVQADNLYDSFRKNVLSFINICNHSTVAR